MPKPIEYILLTHIWFYKNKEILKAASKNKNFKNENDLFIKVIRKFHQKNKKVSDEEILQNKTVIGLPISNTFPKFNNEIPFKFRWDSKWIKNPKILAIRWNGYNWEYELEHIGHKYSFQHEDKLQQL